MAVSGVGAVRFMDIDSDAMSGGKFFQMRMDGLLNFLLKNTDKYWKVQLVTNTMAVIVQSRSPLFKAASGQKGCGWTMQQYIAHVSRVKVYAVVISTQFKKRVVCCLSFPQLLKCDFNPLFLLKYFYKYNKILSKSNRFSDFKVLWMESQISLCLTIRYFKGI